MHVCDAEVFGVEHRRPTAHAPRIHIRRLTRKIEMLKVTVWEEAASIDMPLRDIESAVGATDVDQEIHVARSVAQCMVRHDTKNAAVSSAYQMNAKQLSRVAGDTGVVNGVQERRPVHAWRFAGVFEYHLSRPLSQLLESDFCADFQDAKAVLPVRVQFEARLMRLVGDEATAQDRIGLFDFKESGKKTRPLDGGVEEKRPSEPVSAALQIVRGAQRVRLPAFHRCADARYVHHRR